MTTELAILIIFVVLPVCIWKEHRLRAQMRKAERWTSDDEAALKVWLAHMDPTERALIEDFLGRKS